MTPGAILILSELFLYVIKNIYYFVYVLINWLIVLSYTHTHQAISEEKCCHVYFEYLVKIILFLFSILVFCKVSVIFTGFIKFTAGLLFAFVNIFSIFAYFALAMT